MLAGVMASSSRLGARIALVLTLGGIYGTLGVARQVTNYLRDAGLLRLSVLAAFVLAGVAVVVFLARHPALRRPRALGAMLLCAGVYGAITVPMQSPEETLHFIQYGVVALLSFAAAPVRLEGWKRYLFATVACAAAGWTDEGIQALLPTRYYDLRDVGFNALAGVLALSALAVFRRLASQPAPGPSSSPSLT